MIQVRNRSSRLAPLGALLAIALAVVSIAVRVVVPQGYMVGATGETSAGLVICTSGGASPAPIPRDGDRPASNASHDCVFALASHAAGPVGALQWTPVSSLRPDPMARGGFEQDFRPPLNAAPPPQTGPPGLA